MGKNIRSTRCLFMGKIIRFTIDFLYVKGNRFSAHKLPMIRPPSGTYYLTFNVTLRQLNSFYLGRDPLVSKLHIIIKEIFRWKKLEKAVHRKESGWSGRCLLRSRPINLNESLNACLEDIPKLSSLPVGWFIGETFTSINWARYFEAFKIRFKVGQLVSCL